jgi:hypothetical protein
MMAQLAKRLNESHINVVLTQSASMMNLTSALRTLQVNLSCIFSDVSFEVKWVLGEEGPYRFR